ncbi:UDP-N-acetylmuramoyl-L-alanyl-D-glutamate--2,6-diaminopimelate ligase [Desulfurivibrio sp. D14AmB]|uniref:UDP-N-acetylmuramoyl-L-alanyl-D-glutamate--2, 6-diaminopimelate ligase n=1 Tax=Desulfurivibrio sp. D14AmB TaxID=3374370 RepID=UPI00376ED90E
MNAQTLIAAAAVPGLIISSRQCARLDRLEIGSVTADSRRAGPDSLFVAIAGGRADGHAYLADAVGRGCRMVLTACDHPGGLPRTAEGELLHLEAPDTREAFARLCAAFHGEPARKMVMIGITGTNGKTTSSYLLEDLIGRAGGVPGVIGTVNYRYRQRVVPASHTTPEPETLHGLLAEMAAAGVSHVIMEVSSHALEQGRVAGIGFDVALFTNLSHDHLDYHGDMSSYYAIKKLLFTRHLKPGGAAVVVAGDRWNQRLAAELLPLSAAAGAKRGFKLLRCGFSAGELPVLEQRADLSGVTARLGGIGGEWWLRSSLVGGFNLLNLLGVAGVGLGLGYATEVIEAGLAAAPPPPGRLERFSSRAGVEIFVDYAHTPDALEHVLKALRPHAGRLVVIFGCGGDRDRAKRSVMGEIAGRLADIVILTSDNPRSESPAAILAAIETGVGKAGMTRCRLESLLPGSHGRRGYDLVESRRRAIRDTILFARSGDLLLLCGKGHETTQIVGSTSRYFDDRREVAEQLAVVRC